MTFTLIEVQADCRWSMEKATLALISALYPSFNVDALFGIPPIHNNNIKIRKTTSVYTCRRQKKSIRQREFDIWKQFCYFSWHMHTYRTSIKHIYYLIKCMTTYISKYWYFFFLKARMKKYIFHLEWAHMFVLCLDFVYPLLYRDNFV